MPVDSLRLIGRQSRAGAKSDRMFSPGLHHPLSPVVLGMPHPGWHGRTPTYDPDYLRHSNLNVTRQYLQATWKTKRLAPGKLVDAILPAGSWSASKSTLIQ